MKLRRYWFEFRSVEGSIIPAGVRLGCGVTAVDYNDAVSLIRRDIFEEQELPPVKRLIEDVDVSQLDEGHVLPNMGNVVVRGIWFPLGYSPAGL